MKQLILKKENFLAITDRRLKKPYVEIGPCPNYMTDNEKDWIPGGLCVLSRKELKKFLCATSDREKEKILKKARPLLPDCYYEGFAVPYKIGYLRLAYFEGTRQDTTFYKELLMFRELSPGGWSDEIVAKLRRKLCAATFFKRKKFWVTHLEYLLLEEAGYLPLFELVRSIDCFPTSATLRTVRHSVWYKIF